MKYNLRFSIGCLIVFLAAAPFAYYLQAPIMEIRQHWRAEILACTLILPIFLALGLSPRLARACARDPGRVLETRATALYTSCIIFILLVLAIIGEYVR